MKKSGLVNLESHLHAVRAVFLLRNTTRLLAYTRLSMKNYQFLFYETIRSNTGNRLVPIKLIPILLQR